METHFLQVAVAAQLPVAQASLGGGVTGGCLASPSPAGSWRATWGHRGVDAEGRLAEILVLQAVLRADPPPREVGQEPGRTRHWSRRGAGGAGEHFPLK